MGFLDWMKNRTAQASKQPERQVFLSFGERAALKRLVQHFDDGLVGWPERKPRSWEADLEATATRLGFRDPLGHASVRLERNEAEAVRQLQAACEKDAEFGSSQTKSDIQALRRALDRNGKPQDLPVWELKNETAPPGIPSALTPSAKEPGREESQKPSRTQSKYSGLSDQPPKTEAEVKSADAFSKMRSVINNIANDHASDWSKHWVPFEEAVLGVRKAFSSRVDTLYPFTEIKSKDVPSGAEKQRESASPQQPDRGPSWER